MPPVGDKEGKGRLRHSCPLAALPFLRFYSSRHPPAAAHIKDSRPKRHGRYYYVHPSRAYLKTKITRTSYSAMYRFLSFFFFKERTCRFEVQRFFGTWLSSLPLEDSVSIFQLSQLSVSPPLGFLHRFAAVEFRGPRKKQKR